MRAVKCIYDMVLKQKVIACVRCCLCTWPVLPTIIVLMTVLNRINTAPVSMLKTINTAAALIQGNMVYTYTFVCVH